MNYYKRVTSPKRLSFSEVYVGVAPAFQIQTCSNYP